MIKMIDRAIEELTMKNVKIDEIFLSRRHYKLFINDLRKITEKDVINITRYKNIKIRHDYTLSYVRGAHSFLLSDTLDSTVDFTVTYRRFNLKTFEELN